MKLRSTRGIKPVKYYHIIWILLLLFDLNLSAQEPASFAWGKEELSGLDIYDLIEGSQGNYWIATNQGIYKYNGRDYQHIEVSDSKSASFFNLCVNSKGQIFFNNLSGQIFSISGNEGSLYFQIADSLLSPNMVLMIDNEDHLILRAKTVLRIDQHKNVESILDLSSSGYNMFKAPDESIMVYDGLLHTLLQIKDGKVGRKAIQIEEDLAFNSIIMSGNKTYIYTNEFIFYKLQGNQLILDEDISQNKEKSTFYSLRGDIWARGYRYGIKVYDAEGSPKYNDNVLFKDEFISAVLEDSEQNILLGTFGSGLIFIPAVMTENFTGFTPSQKIRKITTGPNDNLFIATISGEVYDVKKNGDVNYLFKSKHGANIIMDWISSREELWLGDIGLTRMNENNVELQDLPLGSVKDFYEVNENVFLIASNDALYVIDFDNKRPSIMNGNTTSYENAFRLNSFIGRIHRVTYDSINEIIYTATSNGVQYMDNSGSIKEIKLNGISIVGKSIYADKEMIYIGTQNHGLFTVKKGIVQGHWDDVKTVEKIIPYGENILLTTDKGIKIKDKQGIDIKSFGLSDGLIRLKVTDVEVQGDNIWVAHQNGLQKINLDLSFESDKMPILTIPLLKVNEKVTALKKSDFSSSESKFQYVLDSKSMKMKEEIKYQYLMEGIDEEWQETSFYQNEIEYKSLPPGNYVFNAKVNFRGKEGEMIKHSFEIAKPYYQTIWFYVFLLGLFCFLAWTLFKYQLNRKVKISNYQNELNLYKLKAIRSQMNPHFMFNALNSIQEYIIMNERKKAGKYLGKFADLMRIYLHQSDVKLITVQEEVDALNTYLELEKIRFEETLSYFVVVEDNIDTELISIPSLLVQPYVENAIKHGLLHKTENRILKITFRCRQEDKILECEIYDNGIGRKRSMEINELRNPSHKSFASSATKDRLTLLNYGNKKEIGEQIIDLQDETGMAIGTKVLLSIPTVN